MSETNVFQMPVDAIKGGLYEWTLVTTTQKRSGHVVVRGTQAGPIGNFNYAQGTETWYWGALSSPGGSPSFTFKLTFLRAPSDQALVAAVTTVRNTETLAGTSPEIPVWQPGAPLGTSPVIMSLASVTGGPGTYGPLYQHVSYQLPIGGNPLMPTWYTSIAGLYSVFGGNAQQGAPIAEGITAQMTGVSPGQGGYPVAASWFWYGRTPT